MSKLRVGWIIAIAIVMMVVMVIVAANIFRYYQFRRLLTNRASHSFNISREEFQLVADYLMETDFGSSFIRLNEISAYGTVEMSVGQERISVSNERVSDAIRHLSRHGYRRISMEADEGVSFLLWTRALEQGHGIAYMPQGRIHDGIGLLPFMIELEPLDEEGWYYYFEWFSEWRRRQSGG